ncbi:MAG: hypothetical protein WD575_00845, partial [Nitriliruptoraceae bacterium]
MRLGSRLGKLAADEFGVEPPPRRAQRDTSPWPSRCLEIVELTQRPDESVVDLFEGGHTFREFERLDALDPLTQVVEDVVDR